MEQAFRAILHNTSGVIALVPAARINWGEHPQGAANPYIVLTVISEIPGLTMQGPDGLVEFRVQVDVYAPSYGAAKGAARTVIALLHGYRGGQFRLIEHAGSRDSREGGTNEADRLFRVGVDFIVKWRTA
jgi:hypothetical protein